MTPEPMSDEKWQEINHTATMYGNDALSEEDFNAVLDEIRRLKAAQAIPPDLQARIEKLAREAIADETICSCQSCQISAVHAVKNALTTLAEQVIAEKDAEAATLREALVLARREMNSMGNYYGEGPPQAEDGTYESIAAALSSTAGRDTLAELASLRERVRELEGWLQDHALNSEGNNH